MNIEVNRVVDNSVAIEQPKISQALPQTLPQSLPQIEQVLSQALPEIPETQTLPEINEEDYMADDTPDDIPELANLDETPKKRPVYESHALFNPKIGEQNGALTWGTKLLLVGMGAGILSKIL